jgi:hypothetical protein
MAANASGLERKLRNRPADKFFKSEDKHDYERVTFSIFNRKSSAARKGYKPC